MFLFESVIIFLRRNCSLTRLLLGIAMISSLCRWTTPLCAENVGTIDKEKLAEWSAPFRNWHYYPELVIPARPQIAGVSGVKAVDVPMVFRIKGREGWFMTFIAFDGNGYQSYIAESEDLLHWKNSRLAMGYGQKGEFDYGGVVLGAYLFKDNDIHSIRQLKKKKGYFYSLYGAYPRQGGYELRPGYEGIARSRDGIHWEKAQKEPILSIFQKDCGTWEKDCIYQPCLVEYKGKYYDFYNAACKNVEQTGVAFSKDMFSWERYEGNPVITTGLKGSYNAQFSSDPKIFRDGDHWTCIFFGVGRGGAHIMIAFSRDLLHWTVDPEPLYVAGGNPSGIDKQFAHKISLVWNPENDTYYMFYCAVGKEGRGIGLLTSKPLH